MNKIVQQMPVGKCQEFDFKNLLPIPKFDLIRNGFLIKSIGIDGISEIKFAIFVPWNNSVGVIVRHNPQQ